MLHQTNLTDSAAVILAAGEGKRMRSSRPKVLHELAGAPLLEWALDVCTEIGIGQVHVVVGHGAQDVKRVFANRDLDWVEQTERLGTADALRRAAPQLGTAKRVFVLCGDVPLLRAETLLDCIDQHPAGGLSFLTTEVDDPGGYGRVIRDGDAVTAIVEHKDASPNQRAVREINSGIFLLDRSLIDTLLPKVNNDNRQGEYYITDLVGLALEAGLPVSALRVASEEVLGVNSSDQLVRLERLAQDRIQGQLIQHGVRIVSPEQTYIEKGAQVGADTLVMPFSVVRRGARVGTGCEVGPFCHLREGAILEAGAAVGNFVEVKQSRLGKKTKAKHLAYIGNAQIGAGANIGAGTVFANYDGVDKHTTTVGDAAFVGSGTILVAPVVVGDRAVTGAGAVVTRNHDVPADTTVVGVPAKPLESKVAEEER